MSRKEEVERAPIPEDRAERFMVIILAMVRDFGIDEIPEVHRQVEQLQEAVERHVWESRHRVSPQRRVHNERKRFISIFRARYLQLTDLEYRRKITPVDSKVINQVNRTLREEGFPRRSRWSKKSSVIPLSTMSSMTRTSLPFIFLPRPCNSLTLPELFVDAP